MPIFNIRLSSIFFAISLFITGSNGFGRTSPEQEAKYDLALKEAGEYNYSHAIDYLKELINEESTYTKAYIRIAEFYRYDQNLQNGKQYFLEAIQNYPENSNFYFGLALISKYSEDWKSSFESCKDAIDRGATSPETVDLLVESALHAGKTNTLAIKLRQLRKKPSQEHLYYLGYAFWRFRIKNYSRAKTTLTDYLKENNDLYGHSLLGEVNQKLYKFDAAISSYLQANRLLDAKMPFLKIELLHHLGLTYFEIGELDSAEYYFSTASNLARKNGALSEALDINLTNVRLFKKNKQYLKLAESCLTSIEFALAIKESRVLPDLYFDLAGASQIMGDNYRALKYYLLSAEEAQKSQGSGIAAKSLYAIARIYKQRNNWVEAVKFLNESIEIARKAQLSELEYKASFDLANVYESQGEVENAKRLYQRILRNAQNNKLYNIAEACLVKMANLYITHFSNLDRAKYYIARADGLARESLQLQHLPIFRWMQGEISLLENNIEKAETYFLNAIQLGRETGSYNSIIAGNAGLIKTYLKANFPELASAHSDTVFHLIDKYDNLYDDDNPMDTFDLYNDFFTPAITAYSQVGKLLKIYDLCEKYKALKHIKNISPIKYKIKSALADSTRWRLDTYNKLIQQKWSELWELWRTDSEDNLDLVMNIKNRINRLLRDRNIFRLDMAQNQPEYFSLINPTTASMSSLSASLEKFNSIFIHYLVDENTTNILVVRADSIFFKQVNSGRNELIDLVTQISPLFSNQQSGFTNDRNSKNVLFRLDLAGRLYNTIFEPVRAWIPTQSSVIISADDVLNHIPFECLVTNSEVLTNIYDYYHAKYLVEDYEIFYVPYAKFLNWPYKKKNRAKNTYIAFSAPSDLNLSNSLNNNNATNNSNSDYNFVEAKRYETEINQIAEVVGKRKFTFYSNQKSTKRRFLNESNNHRVIHLALPGILEESSPLHSKLFFSDLNDETGFLETYEFFNINLNAEMLVCNFLERKPENLFGANSVNVLVHAINYSGVPSTITSLWNMDEDDSSNKLLIEYFSNLKLGMSKSEALKMAKISHINTVNPNPNYWARYILTGNPRPIKFDSDNSILIIFITLVGAVVLISLVVWHLLRIRREGAN